MRAMVLAAGQGVRLRPLTEELPKPACPVANRPLCTYALDHLAAFGFGEVVLNAHHLAQRLIDVVSPDAPSGLRLRFVVEETLLGTAGAIRHAMDEHPDEEVVLVNGDILFAPDLSRLLAVHRSSGAKATMVVRSSPNLARYGAIDVDGTGRIRAMLRNTPLADPTLRTFMFAGVHVLSPTAVRELPAKGCVVRDGYLRWLARGDVVMAYVDEGTWRELGTLQEYASTNLELASGRLRWPGVERTPSGVLAAPSAVIAPSVSVAEAVVGAGAIVDAPTRRAIVWPLARVSEPADGVIVTPMQRVPWNISAEAPRIGGSG